MSAKGDLSEKQQKALEILWESRHRIGNIFYTTDAACWLKSSKLFKDPSGPPNCVRQLEKQGYFTVSGRNGQGGALEIKWLAKGLEYFGAEASPLASLATPVFEPRPKAVKEPKASVKRGRPKTVPVQKEKKVQAVAQPATAEKKLAPMVFQSNYVLRKPADQSKKIGAVFVDWDNVAIAAQQENVNYKPAMLNFRLLKTIFEQALKFVDKAQFFIFATKKTLIYNPLLEAEAQNRDINLVISEVEPDAADREIEKRAYRLIMEGGISHFIFASGDGFFCGVAKALLSLGKTVVLLPYSRQNLHRNYNDFDRLQVIFLKDRLF